MPPQAPVDHDFSTRPRKIASREDLPLGPVVLHEPHVGVSESTHQVRHDPESPRTSEGLQEALRAPTGRDALHVHSARWPWRGPDGSNGMHKYVMLHTIA